MTLGGQLRLKLERVTDFRRDLFIVSDLNRDAVQALDAWPDRSGASLALIGPPGVGKSHLAWAWASRVGARIIVRDDLEAELDSDLSGPFLLDGADSVAHGEAFFHLLNRAKTDGGCLLLTGRTAPANWSVEVADLRSRLNALPVVELREPDDAILRGVLLKMFDERHIRPPADLMAYLLTRMERSVPAARAIVTALDETASSTHRPISRALARDLLQDKRDDGE